MLPLDEAIIDGAFCESYHRCRLWEVLILRVKSKVRQQLVSVSRINWHYPEGVTIAVKMD